MHQQPRAIEQPLALKIASRSGQRSGVRRSDRELHRHRLKVLDAALSGCGADHANTPDVGVERRVRRRLRTTCRRLVCAWRERRELSRLPQHLVHFRGMELLGVDHLPRELFQRDEASFDEREQFPIEFERVGFGFQ